MLSYKKSLEILKKTNALLEGHFILSSGRRSAKYIQCAQLLSKPHIASALCKSLAQKIKKSKKKIDLILSPAMGGLIIGYEIGRILKRETIFSERVNGKFVLRRNFSIKKNLNVLLVEDVITTGKSVLECAKLVAKSKAKISGYACIIDRSNGKSNIKQRIISQVKINFPSFDNKKLPSSLKKIKATKPGSRGL